jgi:hypothetical protein
MYNQRIRKLFISQEVINVSGEHGEAVTTADIEGVP